MKITEKQQKSYLDAVTLFKVGQIDLPQLEASLEAHIEQLPGEEIEKHI